MIFSWTRPSCKVNNADYDRNVWGIKEILPLASMLQNKKKKTSCITHKMHKKKNWATSIFQYDPGES